MICLFCKLFAISLQTIALPWLTVTLILLVGSFLLVLGLLYGHFRTRRELLARVHELEELSQAGRAIVASELDVDSLCQLIYEKAGKVIENGTFQVGLFHEQEYQIKIWYINGEQQPPQTFDLSERMGLVGWVRDNKQPLLIYNFAKELDTLPARPVYISNHPPKSAIFVPLIHHDFAIGIIAAQSSQPNRFHANDVQRLTILGNQAAAAIANAYLYERERKRAAQLELVGKIAQKVNAIQDLEKIFQQVVLLTHQQFGFHLVSIFSMDAQSDNIIVEASSLNELISGTVCLNASNGLIATAIRTRQTIVANEVQEDEQYIYKLGLPEMDRLADQTHSEIAIPLIVDKEVLGVLDVQSPQRHAFYAQDRTVLEALAAQVAIAIQKARQFQRQKEQAWLTTAQLQVAETISRTAEIDQLLESITRLTTILVGNSLCAILLWDEDQQLYTPNALYSEHPHKHKKFAQTRLRIGDWPPLDAVHVGMEILDSHQPLPWQPESLPVSLYPLIVKNTLLGVLVVHPIINGNSSKELLQGITNQIAQAIHDDLLAIAQQEEAWVNTALLQVAEAVNSLIDLQDILATAVRFVPMLIGVESCLVLIWDEVKKVFHTGPSYGLSEMARGLLASFEIPLADVGVMEVKEEGVISSSPTVYRLSLPNWLQASMQAPVVEALPLYARNQLVGALLVGPSLNGQPLGGRRLNILAGIAHQAAIAVVNDQLYRESAEREKLAQELKVAYSIQTSLMPHGSPAIPGCSVASHWQAAREVSGDFYDFLSLRDGRWGIVIADVADKGMPAAIFMAVSRTILRAVAYNRVSPADTLQRVNEILFHDAQSDLFVTIFYAVWDPQTETLTYANAGHNPPILFSYDGKEQLLRTSGMALGVLERIKIGEKQIRLSPKDLVILYTDGVTEAMNEDYDEFALERLRLTVQNHRDQNASEIVAEIKQAIADHAGNTPQFDDMTLVVLKRTH